MKQFQYQIKVLNHKMGIYDHQILKSNTIMIIAQTIEEYQIGGLFLNVGISQPYQIGGNCIVLCKLHSKLNNQSDWVEGEKICFMNSESEEFHHFQ